MSDNLDYGLENALEGIGASTAAEDWECYDIQHEDAFPHSRPIDEQTYVVDGKTYRVSLL